MEDRMEAARKRGQGGDRTALTFFFLFFCTSQSLATMFLEIFALELAPRFILALLSALLVRSGLLSLLFCFLFWCIILMRLFYPLAFF